MEDQGLWDMWINALIILFLRLLLSLDVASNIIAVWVFRVLLVALQARLHLLRGGRPVGVGLLKAGCQIVGKPYRLLAPGQFLTLMAGVMYVLGQIFHTVIKDM